MTIKEAATLLGWRPDSVKAAIETGVTLSRTGRFIKLSADDISGNFHISDEALEDFVSAYEDEEPGRHPPVQVRRELLVESGHLCAICRSSGPLEFHHIIEFAELRHHDPVHMLAVCPNCHAKATVGQIDVLSQRMYKTRLQSQALVRQFTSDALRPDSAIRFSWDDLKTVITGMRTLISAATPQSSAEDFTIVDLDKKNRLNELGREYFEYMRQHHEPFFGRITAFLSDPTNQHVATTYFAIVDELRSKLAAGRSQFASFEEALLRFVELATQQWPHGNKERAVLTILLSFMYFNCDIGRKS
ncbi:MAG TPA: ABC-three component system protein [Thermoanaerobaculia bacterium]|nr:ABC-three component system protein [Thermoanaerobaculia bacterium]